MDHGTQRVDIGPRPLLALVVIGVLLNRREARAQHGLRLVGEVTDGASCRAEVEQYRQAVILDLNIIQGDIAMQVAFIVNRFDGAEEHWQHAADPRLVDHLWLLLAQTRERGPAVEQRPHVGGIVLDPEAQDVQQVRMVKARQQARLLDKAVQPGRKRLTEALAAQHQGHVIATHGKRGGHELFNGDSTLKLVVPGTIDDAESTAANHLFYLKLIETVPDRQRVWDSPIVIIIHHV